MLGYVIPDKGELKVREYEIYTGYYCGVCKYIGQTYGQLPRMVLSYDATFIALLLASVDDAPDAPRQEHCAVHHIKYKTVIHNRAIEYAGDLMLILAWYKLLDDAQDEGKLSAKAGLAAFRHTWRKLEKKHPDLCRFIGEHLDALAVLEREHCPSIDRASEDFSQIMAYILRDGARWLYGDAVGTDSNKVDGPRISGASSADASEDDVPSGDASSEKGKESPPLHETFANLGYHLGKWIYLIDAVDDIEENLESGVYNPLLYRYEYRFGNTGDGSGSANRSEAGDASESSDHSPGGSAEDPQEFRDRIDEQLRFNLFTCLAVISESFEALDIQKNSGIIENVIYFGLNRKTEEVLKRIKPEKQRHGQL